MKSMSRNCLVGVATLSLGVALGCRGHSDRAAPADPFTAVALSPVPVGAFAGANVLLLAVGGVIVGDSASPLPDLLARRTALVESAYAALDTAVRRDARAVTWMGLDEQRRLARHNPTLGLDPDRFATVFLIRPELDRIPDPLWEQVRTMAAVAGARYALVPAGVKLAGSPGAIVATYVLVLADTRTGMVLWRGRVSGLPAPSAESALASTAGFAIASPLH